MKSAIYNCFSERISVFQEFPLLPQGSTLAGYSALIQAHGLKVPAPDSLCAISPKHEVTNKGGWQLYTPRHTPKDTLQAHLTFALKYEITRIVQSEPTGSYSRRIWFLYEWLTGSTLPLDDVATGNFVELINSKIQYPGPARDSKRHRVRNNLPGNAS